MSARWRVYARGVLFLSSRPALLARNRALAHHSLHRAPDALEDALQLKTSNTERAKQVHSAAAKLAKSVRGSAANLVHWKSRLNFLSVVRNVSSPPSVARHLPTLVIQTLFPHPHLVLVQYHAIGIEDSCTSTTGNLKAAYSQDARFKTMIKTIKEILAPSTDS